MGIFTRWSKSSYAGIFERQGYLPLLFSILVPRLSQLWLPHFAEKYQLKGIPVGQSGSRDKRSAIMADFNTRGTPWTIIIGKDGIVKYNSFHIKPDAAIKLINELKK